MHIHSTHFFLSLITVVSGFVLVYSSPEILENSGSDFQTQNPQHQQPRSSAPPIALAMVPIVDVVSCNELTTLPTYEEAMTDNNEPPSYMILQ